MINSHQERSNLKKVKSVLFSISLCACAIIASVIYGFKDMVEDFGEYAYTTSGAYCIGLEATLISVDPGVGSLTINWDVLGYSQTAQGPNDDLSDDPPAVNIYFDENTLFQSDGSTKYFTNEKPALPIFQFTPALWGTQYTNSANFQTRINLFPKRNRRSRSPRSTSLRIYPFDTYRSEMRLFAQYSATNESVGLTVIDIVGIPGFSAQVTAQDREDQREAIQKTIIISRGHATKAYATIFIFSVWAVTLIFLYSTSMSVICGYPQRVEFLGIPLATFFTVAQVRPTMPGSPEFGVLMDNVGLIPCLSVMAACSALNLGVLIFSGATEERASLGKTFDWIPLGLYRIMVGLCTYLVRRILSLARG